MEEAPLDGGQAWSIWVGQRMREAEVTMEDTYGAFPSGESPSAVFLQSGPEARAIALS